MELLVVLHSYSNLPQKTLKPIYFSVGKTLLKNYQKINYPKFRTTCSLKLVLLRIKTPNPLMPDSYKRSDS